MAFKVKKEEGNKGTDTAFLMLNETSGSALLKLIGVKDPEKYQGKATVLKEKMVKPDLECWPALEKEDGERIFIEFQGYSDRMIRHRLASRMTLFCSVSDYDGPIRGVILYTKKKYQEIALPLQIKNQEGQVALEGEFQEICLTDYSEEELLRIDPRLIPLVPFTLKEDIDTLSLYQKAKDWSSTVAQAYPKSLNVQKKVLDIFTLFLIHRFKKLDYNEVLAMLNLNLTETQVGKDLIQMGVEQGLEQGVKQEAIRIRNHIIKVISINFRKIPDSFLIELEKISNPALLESFFERAIASDSWGEFLSFFERNKELPEK